MNFYNSISHSSPKAGVTLMITSWWVDNPAMVDPHSGSLGQKKEWSDDMYHSVQKPWTHLLKARSQTWKATCCMGLHIWNIQSLVICPDRMEISSFQGLRIGGGEKGDDCQWLPIFLLGVMIIVQLYECSENHKNLYFKRVNFMISELYLNKLV
jgi:hypothetical protein